MPLPWKKTKPNRISRIVADLQPPSRAASLVVETGFPTSVVDLFVKNRDRIKRHSLKKSKHKHSPLHSSQSMAAAPPPTPSDDSPLLPGAAAVHGLDDHLENSAAATDVESNVVENAIAIANEKLSVFDLAAKMLLAVAPVLSSSKLAVWIVVFAFLLEILGQIVPRFFDLSSIQNRLLWTTKAEAEQEIPPITILSDEIEVVEWNSDYEQSALSESFRNGETEIGCSSSSLGMEMEGEKNERSRSSKLRAKIMKKLIPKKLRSGKRVKRNYKNEKNKMKESTIMENESSGEEEQEVWAAEEEGIGSSTMRKGEDQEQEQDQRKMDLELKIVMGMILLGLCVNRFVALVLAVSGCFMFKFIKSLKPKWKFG